MKLRKRAHKIIDVEKKGNNKCDTYIKISMANFRIFCLVINMFSTINYFKKKRRIK